MEGGGFGLGLLSAPPAPWVLLSGWHLTMSNASRAVYVVSRPQIVNVSLPGQAPPLMDAKEDTRLLLDELGGKAGVRARVCGRGGGGLAPQPSGVAAFFCRAAGS